MNINQMQRLLKHLYRMSQRDAYMSTLIWGQAGVGKTQTVAEAARMITEEIGEPVVSRALLIAQMDVGDLIGLPREQRVYPDFLQAAKTGSSKLLPKSSIIRYMRQRYPDAFPKEMSNQEVFEKVQRGTKEMAPHFDDEFRTVYALPEWFPEPGTRGILFLDEINRSVSDVRQAIFQLLLDRTLHNVKLPDGWIVVAAANPQEEGYHVAIDFDDKAFISRFLHVGLRPTAEEWLAYAAERNLMDSIRSLIAGDPEQLGNLNITIPDVQPTPRSWTLLAEVLPDLDDDLVRPVATGIVGGTAAGMWIALQNNPLTPISGRELLSGYGNPILVNPVPSEGAWLVGFDSGDILNLGENVIVENSDTKETFEIRPRGRPPKDHPRTRMSVFVRSGRNDLIGGTLTLLENELVQIEKNTAPGRDPLTDHQVFSLIQILRDMSRGGYNGLVWNFVKTKISTEKDFRRISNQLSQFNAWQEFVLSLVVDSKMMEQEEVEVIKGSMREIEDLFGAEPGTADGYDPDALNRLLAVA